MSGFDAPNFTPVPNKLFALLPDMHDTELRVTLVIARQTWGYQDSHSPTGRKVEDELSLTQLQQATGLSRQGVIDGIEQGMTRGTIARRPRGRSFLYRLVVNSVDQSTQLTSQLSRPRSVNSVDHQIVNSVDTQKKGLKERKKEVVEEVNTPTPRATTTTAAPDQQADPIAPATRLTIASLPDTWRDDCFRLAPHFDPDLLFGAFRDHYALKNIRVPDWQTKWREWIRRELRYEQERGQKAQARQLAPVGAAPAGRSPRRREPLTLAEMGMSKADLPFMQQTEHDQ